MLEKKIRDYLSRSIAFIAHITVAMYTSNYRRLDEEFCLLPLDVEENKPLFQSVIQFYR